MDINTTINNLKKNGFKVEYFNTLEEVKNKILEDISLTDDVGIGGSMTVYQMKLHEELIQRGNKVYWHWLVDPDKRNEVRRKAQNTEIYISSSNAITEDGKLVNIDGIGNRVASMFYGHKRVYVIAGVNKIAKNIDEGIKRIKRESCPKNAQRLGLNTPCRYTGECNDCRTEDRMCNITVILEHKPMQTDIYVYLVNDQLGY